MPVFAAVRLCMMHVWRMAGKRLARLGGDASGQVPDRDAWSGLQPANAGLRMRITKVQSPITL